MNLTLVITLPFVLLVLLALVFRRPLWQSATAAYACALGGWWTVPEAALAAPSFRAFVLAWEVGLILFGAITFLEYLTAVGTTEKIKAALSRFSSGRLSVEALLLAWLFCGFLEGAAGFGAPAALLAPLLASLGLPPLLAATLPLVGDSAAVPFGAVGTPVRLGLAGLPAQQAGVYAAGLNLVAGLVAPLAIVKLVSRHSGEKPPYGLALWSGVCFTVPAFAVAFVGPEFPSLAGSLLGLLVFSGSLLRSGERPGRALWNLVTGFSPYLLVCVGLLAGKLLLGDLKFQLGPQQVGAFQPGLVFLLVLGLLAIGRRDRSWRELKSDGAGAARRLPLVWLAIFCLAGLAQLVVANTGNLMQELGGGENTALALLLIAPLAGALGAFVAGSATVACLLTGPFLAQWAALVDLEAGLVLGLQVVGAGAGNMVSLQNLAAVQATVGLVDQEVPMLHRLWRPCAAYVALTTLVGLAVWKVL